MLSAAVRSGQSTHAAWKLAQLQPADGWNNPNLRIRMGVVLTARSLHLPLLAVLYATTQ